ncbi:coiled-coil domain-containing protein 40 isoform X2 [Fundulus heteroclitus]|uniref:coiled-coil domain-containing protein 40 isoform X2 n=1 Tax=Fundulus heteroclitus TaxID=8078 RepID=UPI00165BBA8A|nr:coiled-coil domain-containing protein 40 isoform X2 [Fundulus heteroclitus]
MENARDEDQHDEEDLLMREDGTSGVTVPLSLENPPAQQSDSLTPPPVLDPNMAAQVPHQLSLGTAEDVTDEEPPREEEDMNEEFIILDPEHPLIKRFQDALNIYFSKRLEKNQQELKKQRETKKEEARQLQEVSIELFNIQEQLTKIENKLSDSHQAKAQAEAQRRHAQDQLQTTKSKYSDRSSQSSKAKTKVSRLQAELEKTMQHVIFAQAVSEDLHSKVKIMNNVRHKVGTEKTQAEEEKIKQDLYVERLTKDLENRTLQAAGYEVQRNAQAQETLEASKSLAEAEMELESLLMMHKKLLQQWNSNIADIRKHDETVNAMQEAVRAIEDEVILLGREIEGYKKSTAVEQENNETLTVQLNWCEMDCVTWNKLISQKQTAREVLQAQYSACLRSLTETKHILATLTKEMSANQTELNNQRSQEEKLSAARLELEENIMAHIQQQLTHSKAATFSQQLISKMATRKKDKMHQLQQLERDSLSVKLESQKVEQQVNSLILTVETLEEELNKQHKLLTSHENVLSSLVRQIKQKETTINNLKNRISHIVESTGQEDLSPLQIQIKEVLSQIQELAAHIKNDHQLWMLHQGTLVGLSRELGANSKKIRKLQKDNTGMQQKEIRLDSQTEQEEREQAELDKNSKLLRRDLEKLSKLMKKNKQQSETLELENILLETDFIQKLKEAEQESVSVQMKLEKTQEEKENLFRNLLEAERQILLWEKKTQILKETRSVVESELGQEEIQKMKVEIHRMELRVNQLTKEQERLMRESEAAVARRENLVLRKEAMVRGSHKEITKDELRRSSEGLQSKIQKTLKEIADCELVMKELEKGKTIQSEKLLQQKQHLAELCSTWTKLDNDLANLQDNQYTNQAYLIALQSRNKKLRDVCEGSYKLSSSEETVGAALQSQRERLEDYRSALKRNCEDLPQHQEALRHITQAVEAYIKISQQ